MGDQVHFLELVAKLVCAPPPKGEGIDAAPFRGRSKTNFEIAPRSRPRRRGHRRSLLTRRQVEILKLVASGTRYREIAARVFISEKTVNREMHNIFNRLGVNDVAHAVSEAYKSRLI